MVEGGKMAEAVDEMPADKTRLDKGSFLKAFRELGKFRSRQKLGRFKGTVSLGGMEYLPSMAPDLNVAKIYEYYQSICPDNLPQWFAAIVSQESGAREYIEKAFSYIMDVQNSLMKDIDSVPSHSHSQKVSKLEQNIKQNRYPNILPYEASRISLVNSSIPSGGYVNASRVGGFMGIPNIIATQGPLRSTTEAFWCLVWEQSVAVVLMIVQDDVLGSPSGCYKYWPNVDKKMVLENSKMTLSLLSERYVKKHEIYIRKFELLAQSIDGTTETRQVVQIQYVGWIDFDVTTAEKVLYVYDLINAMMLKCADKWPLNSDAPSERSHNLAIHCSAGCGRTGTFIAIYSVLEVMKNAKLHYIKDLDYSLMAPTDKSEAKLRTILRRTITSHKQKSVFDSTPMNLVVVDPLGGYFDIVFIIVLALRSQRTYMVFAHQQYALIYEAVALRIYQWQSQTPIDFPSWIKRYTQASLMRVSETSWSQLADVTILPCSGSDTKQ